MYEDWHNKDPDHEAIPIRLALLHCLHQTTHCSLGRDDLVAQGGISLLYHTTQTCLASKGLESLVEPAVQLMRKCYPKCPLPLTSDQSVYTFPLPGRPTDTAPGPQGIDLDSDSEVDSSSDEEGLLNGDFRTDGRSRVSPRDSPTHSPVEHPVSTVEGDQDCKGEPPENHLQACDFHSHFLSSSSVKQDSHPSMVDRLLEKHRACIPHHDPRMYTAAAALTKSIPGYSILAFPDFWGHLPPQSKEPMAGRKPNVQSSQGSPDHSDSLRFFSKFECGNLRKAVQVRSGMAANVPYRFNIINCDKANSQFNYGMQPVLYSVREALEGRPNWIRTGTEICYYRNSFCPSRGRKSSSFYTLTFTVTFKHNEDVPVVIAVFQSHLQVLQRSVDPRKVFFRQQSLCNTLAGNPCPLVTITACPSSKSWKDLHQLRNRPCVVLTARVHPGESNASWVMKGTLEFLCSSDPVAETLREAYIFKIIPMLNPDGVINGTYVLCTLTPTLTFDLYPQTYLSPSMLTSTRENNSMCVEGNTVLLLTFLPVTCISHSASQVGTDWCEQTVISNTDLGNGGTEDCIK
ncbi:unnamed protein product [Coregonus sp. 'balchen']|nr:unnamed protein product [Coregonus sp. 'balchen']